MDVASHSWETGEKAGDLVRNREAGEAFFKLVELMAQAEKKAEARSHRPHQQPAVTTCVECHQDFPDLAALSRHQQKQHSLRKPHRCKACRQEFALLSSLQLHKCLGSPSAAMCQLCRGKAQRGAPCSACSSDLLAPKGPTEQAHLFQYRDSSPYACAPCGRAFSHKQELLYHQQAGGCQPAPLSPKAVKPSTTALASFTPAASTPTPSYGSLPPSSPPMPYDCLFCSRVFRSPAGLANHQRTWHPNQWRKNPSKLSGKSAVNVKTAVQKSKVNAKAPQKMPGTKCKQSLSGSVKKRDTGGGGGGGGGDGEKKHQLFPCRSCDKVFSLTSTLHQHRREVHRREKKRARTSAKSTRQRKKCETYPCPICGKVFLHHLTRWAHLRTHSAQQQSQMRKVARPAAVKPPPPPKDAKTIEKHPQKKAKKTKSGSAIKAEAKKRRPEQEKSMAEDDELEEDEEDGEFPCPSCLEVFSSPSALDKHQEVHQPAEVTKSCCVCNEDITSAEGERGAAVPELLYHCVPCRQAFTTLPSFLRHCRIHLSSDSDVDRSDTDSADELR